jgi:SpoIID/LytB domain
MKIPEINVGVIFSPQIEFVLNGDYVVYCTNRGSDMEGNKKYDGASNEECDKKDYEYEVSGRQVVRYNNGDIEWNGKCYKTLLFEPKNIENIFELIDVTIGINFHWERKENQSFKGAFKVIVEDEKLTGINVINIEDYLISVISSEMSATASLELLKAHSVISRSWLLAQIKGAKNVKRNSFIDIQQADKEYIKWYDREDHKNFDVCADDHCQRYQGVTKASTEIVKKAVSYTRGEVLTYKNEICDARFSKCCGGAFEEFKYCWEDVSYPYLAKKRDSKDLDTLPDLTIESEAQKWIRSNEIAFCNTKDKRVLSQVLNNYDQETTDFFRWQVKYSQKELAEIIFRRSGVDFGEILDLVPIARGVSGRLWKLKVVGSKRSLVIGKELEIRRILSNSHLYSSAFVVDKEIENEGGTPKSFTIIGAGWGHGVGLCQIGAAVMGEKGYKYDEILLHYYIGAKIDKLY